MFEWIEIAREADYQQLEDHLPTEEFGLRSVIEQLQLHVSGAVGSILVEYPYVDKDYRSTFYHYYSKKGGHYSPDCARIHFLGKGWRVGKEPLAFLKPDGTLADDSIEQGYFGFMVLRPTRAYTIGRTVIAPQAVADMSGKLIVSSHKAHILGHRTGVRGFPYMQQHGDIAVCAHTACWAILRHYSERYSLYPEVLLHQISQLGREFNPGGLLPSLGITYVDAERIFAAAGTFPLFVPRLQDEDAFYTELVTYVDSGFPLFGVQTERRHAVAVVGYRMSDTIQAEPHDGHESLWNYVSDLLVIDDNRFPYRPVGRHAGEIGYDVRAFDAFIVPLPEKIFLPASAVITLARDLTDAPVDHFESLADTPHLVVRHFLTTTAAWHRHIRKSIGTLPHHFSRAALDLAMPQFIWVVEYATREQWAQHNVEARLILDATAGKEPFPAFLLHDAKGALWLDRATRRRISYQAFASTCGPLPRMDSNLEVY